MTSAEIIAVLESQLGAKIKDKKTDAIDPFIVVEPADLVAVAVALRDHPRLQGGNLLKLGLGGYALFRFGVEFVRTNRVLALGLTGQQYACRYHDRAPCVEILAHGQAYEQVGSISGKPYCSPYNFRAVTKPRQHGGQPQQKERSQNYDKC